MLTVALYGNSLALDSIGAALEGRAGLQIIHVGARSAASRPPPEPDVVVFDRAAPPDGHAFCPTRPTRFLLIGVNLDAHDVLVLSGDHLNVLSPDDLVRLIESHARGERKPG